MHDLAGKPAPESILIDPEQLERDYYEKRPDMSDPTKRVIFGTSGHRGTPLKGTFTESHVKAIVQTIIDYRNKMGYNGPLYLGKDTHAISDAAHRTALEVLAANGVETVYQQGNLPTPTPVISHAILTWNREHPGQNADGIIITPSHNPPSDGGIKYNPPTGGAADTDITRWMQERANALLEAGNTEVRTLSDGSAYTDERFHELLRPTEFSEKYIADLATIIDFDVIRKANIRIGVDPLGGAGIYYWKPIAERYGLDLTVVNDQLDPTFSFMTCDHDGKIRMDCSSPWSMKRLVAMKDAFDIATANDPDADRHGIVVPSVGLMNPNHFLAAAIEYLLKNRPDWPREAGIGKTLVSSGMIDRVVADHGRQLIEVPVGFKWFVPGLLDSSILFGGEESAGASFLRRDGTVWTTDKDGIILALLASEMLARTGRDPGQLYQELERKFGSPVYRRVDVPTTLEGKAAFANLTPEKVTASELAGEPILAKLTHAPGNGAPIGGLKVVTKNGWFAARPSGTENIYKIYGESFMGTEHLDQIFAEAEQIVAAALLG